VRVIRTVRYRQARFNNKTRATHDNNGVQVRIPGWGNPKYVEYLDTAEDSYGPYFANIANRLVKMGYVRNKNLLGAPYDFRKAASAFKSHYFCAVTFFNQSVNQFF
jgi:lysophospholipase-3